MVEKPRREDAPSNLSIVGRYILPPEIFECLERTQPGAKGEIQLTDGMLLLLENNDFYAYEFHGIRYDGGTPMGLLRASLEYALRREDTREAAENLLRDLTTSN
jgi:UTP--glucose-1-phosphate uridylyltransferase